MITAQSFTAMRSCICMTGVSLAESMLVFAEQVVLSYKICDMIVENAF